MANLQRRSAPRIRVRGLPARLRAGGFPSFLRREEPVRVMDIGPKGMSFTLDRALEEDTHVRCVIDFPESRRVQCTGKVKNLRKAGEEYRLGVEFTRVSREGRDLLGDSRNILAVSEETPPRGRAPIRDRIRTLRRCLGLTVVELAEMSRVSPTQIVEIENGLDASPSEDLLYRLAGGMGLPVSELKGTA